jgi:hypothetical protein
MLSIEQIVRRVRRDAGRIQLSAMKRTEGEMKLRIFTNGEATDGSKLGSYRSESHKVRRQRSGRQIRNKDLNLEGDLFRETITGEQNGKAVLGIATNKRRIIAEAQERQTGKTIFALSEKEKDLVFRTVNAEIKALLNAR